LDHSKLLISFYEYFADCKRKSPELKQIGRIIKKFKSGKGSTCFFPSKTQLQFEAAHFWQDQKLLSTFDADFFDKKISTFLSFVKVKNNLICTYVKLNRMSLGIFSAEIESNTR
jgi:hypothetical protein